MSDNQPVVDELKASYERQRELIDKAKAKVVKADQEWKDEFATSWIYTTKRGGVTSEAAGLFCEAYKFSGAEPFYRYVVESHDNSAYKKLFTSPSLGQLDNSVCLRLSIELLGLELMQPTSGSSLDLLASRIPSFARTKANSRSKIIVSHVKRFLVKPFTKQTISRQANIEVANAASLLRELKDPIETAYADSKNDREAEAAEQLLAWLEGRAKAGTSTSSTSEDTSALIDENKGDGAQTHVQEQSSLLENVSDEETSVDAPTEPKAAKADIERIAAPSPEQTTPSQPQRREPPKSDSPTIFQNAVTARKVDTSDLDMATVIKFLTGYEHSYRLLDEQFERLRTQRSEASGKVRELTEDLASAEAEVAKLQEDKGRLTLRVSKLEEEVAQLGRENNSLQGDVSDAADMIGMVDRQHEERLEAYKEKVGSDLKADYLDFQSIYGIDMEDTNAVDIAENLRLLVESIFEILNKNGIVP